MYELINEGINKGTYIECEDTILSDLKHFKAFLYNNFSKYEHYKEMRPQSNQAARLYETAKTHKCKTLADINIENLKIRPIMDQIGTMGYKASQIIAKYLHDITTT